MLERVKVRIDEQTIKIFKEKIGSTIVKIGYVNRMENSSGAVLIFNDNSIVKIKNTAASEGAFDEEYPHISARETKLRNDIAFKNVKYTYFNTNFTIERCNTIIDYVTWKEDGNNDYFDIENGIMLEDKDGKIFIIYAFDSICEEIAIYQDSEKFEKDYSIKEWWPIDADDVKYERIYKKMM